MLRKRRLIRGHDHGRSTHPCPLFLWGEEEAATYLMEMVEATGEAECAVLVSVFSGLPGLRAHPRRQFTIRPSRCRAATAAAVRAVALLALGIGENGDGGAKASGMTRLLFFVLRTRCSIPMETPRTRPAAATACAPP